MKLFYADGTPRFGRPKFQAGDSLNLRRWKVLDYLYRNAATYYRQDFAVPTPQLRQAGFTGFLYRWLHEAGYLNRLDFRPSCGITGGRSDCRFAWYLTPLGVHAAKTGEMEGRWSLADEDIE